MNWELFRPSRTTAVCLVLLSLSFLLMAFRLTHTVQALRNLLFYWISPSYESVSSALNSSVQMGNRIGELIRTHQDNAVLQEKMKQVSLMESIFTETKAQNRRFKNMLDFRANIPYETIPALIVGRDAQNWMAAVWIDRGTNDGVEPDSPVIALQGDPINDAEVTSGVIGRVLECGANSSKVLLISDPLSSIAVSLSRSEEQGLVQGQGSFEVALEYLNQTVPFEPGDSVVTSGLGGIFPAGLPVGKLKTVIQTRSGFSRAEVTPSVSLSRLREVIVLRKALPLRKPTAVSPLFKA